jgi:hypothetical protein
MGALLNLIGQDPDHQITAEAHGWFPAIQLSPRKPQLVRGSIRQFGNLVFGGYGRASRSVALAAGLTDDGQRLARILASRYTVDGGSHALAGSAMR